MSLEWVCVSLEEDMAFFWGCAVFEEDVLFLKRTCRRHVRTDGSFGYLEWRLWACCFLEGVWFLKGTCCFLGMCDFLEDVSAMRPYGWVFWIFEVGVFVGACR